MADSSTYPTNPIRRAGRHRLRARLLVAAVTLGVLAAFVPLASPDASASEPQATPQSVADIEARVNRLMDRAPSCTLSDHLGSFDASSFDTEVLNRIALCLESQRALAEKQIELAIALADYLSCIVFDPYGCGAELSHLEAVENEYENYSRDVFNNCNPVALYLGN